MNFAGRGDMRDPRRLIVEVQGKRLPRSARHSSWGGARRAKLTKEEAKQAAAAWPSIEPGH